MAWVAWVRGWHGSNFSVGGVGGMHHRKAWVAWVKIVAWVAWVYKYRRDSKKKTWVTWIKILAWSAWVHKILAWLAWIYKIGVGWNFAICRKDGLCQNKMEWVKIFSRSLRFPYLPILSYSTEITVLCRLSGPAEAGDGE